MLKKLAASFVFILLLSLFILPKVAFAVNIEIIPVDDNNNPVTKLDENAAKAKITYTDLPANTEFIFCGMWHNSLNLNECSHEIRIHSDSNNPASASVYVCGDLWSDTSHLQHVLGLKYNQDCGSGDYFHEHSYSMELQNTNSQKVLDSPLNVGPYIPDIKITAESANPQSLTPTDKLKLTITGGRRPYNNSGKRNNYSFTLTRDDNAIPNSNLQKPNDINVTGTNGSISSAGSSEFGPLETGAYTLHIQSQWDDSKFFSNILIQFSTDPKGGSMTPIEITNLFTGGSTAQTYNEPPSPNAPCAKPLSNGQCPAVKTAIGDINTEPTSFVTSIFSLILGISGGVALILIIISGYRLMASQGNPEQIQGAREMLTSAIVGLLFIIFSFVILQVIGVNILHIPGFG